MGGSGFSASEKNRTSRMDPSQSIRGGFAGDDARLLASLPYLTNLDTTHRGRVAVPQPRRRERGDNSFLIGSDQVRECTGFEMKVDNLLRLVNGVRAVVRDRFWN